MKKGNTVQKKNLKLRRQIRRTLGALFMISAIVVAAIPVQDIRAVDLSANITNTDTRAVINYAVDTDFTLPGSEHLDPTGKTEIESYYVRKLGDGSWSYTWQFRYYLATIGGAERAIISKYNDLYPEEELRLSNSANAKYYVVTNNEFVNFYATGAGSLVHGFSYDPEFKAYKLTGRTTPDMDWIKKYRTTEYNNFMAICEAYYKYEEVDLKKYYVDKAIYDRDLAEFVAGGSVGTAPTEPTMPAEPPKPTVRLEFTPNADFLNEEKYKFYCDMASAQTPGSVGYLEGTGYTLVAVTDNTANAGVPGSGIASTVYLAQGGQPLNSAYNDTHGFLVTQRSAEIIGIANNAFASVSNVNTLIMPSELKYLGNEAFLDSFIKSINLHNVENIGHRAFQGCTQLSTMMMSSTKRIGIESFKSSGITNIKFPYSLSEIGDGAFAECKQLNSVDLSAVSTSCVIGKYAFFNDYALNSVEMERTGISSIGEGAFAITSAPSGSWKDVKLPEQITGASGSSLGDVLFAGRSNLNSVKFPSNYGTNNAVNIPSGMFRNCASLGYIDFTAAAGSIICGSVGYDHSGTAAVYNNMFIDVTNPDFYVTGPEKNLAGATAFPRQSAWKAFTKISNFVPYVYINDQGVKCYEVSDGTYLLQANENGELTSCELIDRTGNDPIDLIIPSKVGDYPVKTIANGCFSDDRLRDRLRSITIEDDSLIKLDDSVFAGLPILERVVIGNSVQSIGKQAFADCNKLTDVTFHTPSIGHAGFVIGEQAFKTGSNELTLHGDIVQGYAPFEFALGKDTGKIDEQGKRICYKSLSPDFLTVMYDNQSQEVTLLDYPKYGELDRRNADHCRDMEVFYTQKYGTGQTAYDNDRTNFKNAWLSADTQEKEDEVYNGPHYGPWVDATFAGTVGSSIYGNTPTAFYTRNSYSILDNYERGETARGEFETVTDEELRWINACTNVVIPAGVTSIDAKAFFEATPNERNVITYFNASKEGYDSYKMCTQTTDNAVPGLFSGFYKDFDTDSEYETAVKGNDRILTVAMSTVKKLPDYAFDSCEQLQKITLGPVCSDIGKAPFRGCGKLTDVVGNDYFVIGNRIIYSVNEDKTYTVKECLSSRGALDSSPVIDVSLDPNLKNVSAIVDGAFEDCQLITRVYLEDATNLKIIPKDCFNNCTKLQSVNLPKSVNRIEDKAFGNNRQITVTIPGKEVHIVKDAFEHETTNTIRTYRGTSADDYGQYYKLDVQYLTDNFTVDFFNYDGTKLCETQEIESGRSAVPPEDPKREGHTFTGWLPKEFNNVTSNMVIFAQYKDNSAEDMRHTVTFYGWDNNVVSTQSVPEGGAATAPMPPKVSGYKFVEWKPNTYTNVKKDLDILAVYEKDTGNNGGGSNGNATASPSPSPSATPSPEDAAKKYTVSVSGGSGSGSYAAGAIVSINAYAMGEGYTFDKWTTSTAGVGFASATASSTTFTMPAANAAITATYKSGTGEGSNAGTGGGSGTEGTGTSGSGTDSSDSSSGTRVEIDRPGISNTDLAGATVNGATDNFVVKIKETQEATDASVAALQAKYGDISKIKYLPMDISLYDSEGRNKITDTTGISVNITLPLPDTLVEYAGNNKIASSAGGQLEDLSSKFATIDGVPCINFTATHFSPYVIYVDTANLTEGTIDSTPQTGDMIHPKWFLAIGLACISLILFFKRDRNLVKIKPSV